ncbi:BAP_1a_G0005440.mRNA.1.CDS.1 [Saccharomyces cerevisiae]|nr:Hbn1p [Saccharomyces cerevisiae YJM1433]CAI4297132.1 BAP_1a_G0005440.mRNA.1.CDS.1 [Saccharomyces cerevisiae]CAI7053840.1 BAP_1a_G0005440.mRNA.1.CDS.1 [Saccharomyces cerevisiae]
MSAVATYLKTLTARRTIYALKPELPGEITIKDIQSVVQTIIRETPTAFNSQPNRAVILTGETHKKVWDEVTKAIESPAGQKRPASARDEAFGSVIFFTDDKVTEKLKADFPAYAAAFPSFADHTSGAAQINSWVALEAMGLGGHLQHYNGYIKAALPSKIPESWTVQAQLVFGTPAAPPGEKTYIKNDVEIFN